MLERQYGPSGGQPSEMTAEDASYFELSLEQIVVKIEWAPFVIKVSLCVKCENEMIGKRYGCLSTNAH